MGYGETLLPSIKVGNIKDPSTYYKNFSGSQLVCTVLDGTRNVIARGTGFSFNENYQQLPIMEWGQRKSLEIVTGAMPPGQIQVQSMFFMSLNDNLPTIRELPDDTEFTVIVQIASHENAKYKGLILDVFTGVKIASQAGNWNAQSQYMRNAQMIYRERMTGLQWLQANSDLANSTADHAAYPAEIQ